MDEGKVLTSLASEGRYHLAVHERVNAPPHFLRMGSEQSYGYEEYCTVLKTLWQDYLASGKRPQLLGQPLTDEGLVTETLHCIAPGTWALTLRLPAYREEFSYWLRSQSVAIRQRLDSDRANSLERNLEYILASHVISKRKAL